MSRLLLITVQALGMIWALPITALGLIAGAVAVSAGARVWWSQRDLALIFQNVPWGPGGALTLGNVILHTGADINCRCTTYAHRAGVRHEPSIVLADHERAHVYQYMVLGAFFLPLYFACGGISVRNRFERAADRYAQTGHSWWPWSSPV